MTTAIVDLVLEQHLAALNAAMDREDAGAYCDAVDALLAYLPMPAEAREELLRSRRDAETFARLEALAAGRVR